MNSTSNPPSLVRILWNKHKLGKKSVWVCLPFHRIYSLVSMSPKTREIDSMQSRMIYVRDTPKSMHSFLILSFGSLHLTHLRKCRCTGWKAQQTSLILFLVYVDFSFATLNGLTRLEVCYEYIHYLESSSGTPRSMCFSSCCPYQSKR